jgi:hypothetical protein
MGELDTKAWIEAARSYRRLRRQYWGGYLGFMAACLLVAMDFVLAEKLHRSDAIFLGILIIAFSAAIPALFVSWVAWFKLAWFRCPRCGRQGIVSRSRDHCNHCDLDLGKRAIAKGKPLDVVDRLE